MALIYFSRESPPHPLQERSLVAGVIEADDAEAAKAKLDALLAKGLSRADEFSFLDLAGVERVGHGVLAITMREG